MVVERARGTVLTLAVNPPGDDDYTLSASPAKPDSWCRSGGALGLMGAAFLRI